MTYFGLSTENPRLHKKFRESVIKKKENKHHTNLEDRERGLLAEIRLLGLARVSVVPVLDQPTLQDVHRFLGQIAAALPARGVLAGRGVAIPANVRRCVRRDVLRLR